MIKLMCFVRRHPDLSVEEFHDHWRTTHAQLIRDNAAARRVLVRYEQNHRAARDYERAGGPDFDGVAVQWFRSFRDFVAMISDPEYQATVGVDERRLLDLEATVFVMTEAEEVVVA